MKKQLRILSILDIPWNSGLTDYAIKQSKALSLNGHKIYFAAPLSTLCHQTISKENFEIINITERKNQFIIPDIFKIVHFIKKNQIQILNTHTGRTQTIAVISSYFDRNVKIIRNKTDVSISQKNIMSGKISKIICASDFIKQNCIKGNFKSDKLTVIPPPAPDFKIPMPGFPENQSFKIGILSRLDLIKGHKHFLEMAKILLNKGFKLQFIIGGYETKNLKYSDIKEYAIKLGIEKNIKYEGRINNPEEFIKNCDIGVITSIGSEAVSRVLLEWMTAGRPVIATTVGCIPEILDSKYLVPPTRSELMAEKIITLINSEDEFISASTNNKGIIEKKYNITLFSKNTEKEFLNIAYE